MKLIADIKLKPTEAQADSLKRTLETANAAANFLSDLAWETQEFRRFDLQKAGYYAARDQFGLTAQMVIRILAKVADAYKLDKKTKRSFRSLGSTAYDNRILAYKTVDTVSIWTVDGRQTIPFVGGTRQLALLQSRQGEADLVYRNGEYFLYQTCDVPTPDIEPVDDFLGVDLGVVNIAVDSDATVYAGNAVNRVRHRNRRLRTKLQAKGTKAARRRLKKLSGKERRFAKHVNHEISCEIVQTAERTARGIALEELTGIRERIRARRGQRAVLHSWSFFQLRSFIEYKAQRAGVPLVTVDPRNTSRTCPCCGHIDKANRPNQATFLCVNCGFSGLADHVAAENIRGAAVSRPYISTTPRVST